MAHLGEVDPSAAIRIEGPEKVEDLRLREAQAELFHRFPKVLEIYHLGGEERFFGVAVVVVVARGSEESGKSPEDGSRIARMKVSPSTA